MGQMIGIRVLCLAIGYAFGLFQTAYILGKRSGIDIRNYGSGNAGTTNMMRVKGTKAGIMVFFGDLLKCFFAVWLVWLLFHNSHPESVYLLKTYAFAGCVLGHDFPFYMNFKGGKGVASLAGFVMSFHWTLFPVCAFLFFVPFLTTHFVSLGSLMVYGGMFLQIIFEGQLGMFGETPQNLLIEMYVVQLLLTALAYYRHRANIVRLATGTEKKTYLKKKK